MPTGKLSCTCVSILKYGRCDCLSSAYRPSTQFPSCFVAAHRYLAASHLHKNEKADEALTVLQAGLKANPTRSEDDLSEVLDDVTRSGHSI